jgi:hypothetical protein
MHTWRHLHKPTFIYNHIRELAKPLQLTSVTNSHLVGSNYERKVFVSFFPRIQRTFEHGFPVWTSAMIANDWILRKPALEFPDPIRKCSKRSYNEIWAIDILCQQVRDQGDALNRFSQAPAHKQIQSGVSLMSALMLRLDNLSTVVRQNSYISSARMPDTPFS